jgi:hypothetical protein
VSSDPRKDVLQDYRDAGLRLVKIKPGLKAAYEKQWGKLTHEPDDIPRSNNVGIIFENGLYDLDFDTPETRKLSGFFFGDCPSFRRQSLPVNEPGHRLVRSTDGPGGKTVYGLKPADQDLMGKCCLMELRSSTVKKHHQTVVPPSRYWPECWTQQNGSLNPNAPPEVVDNLIWEKPFNPDSIPTWEWATLQRAAALLSFSAIALKHYPGEGGRDDYCLKFAGALLTVGMSAEDADALVAHVAQLAGDDERREGKATYTERRKDEGVQVNGLPGFLAQFESDTLEKTVRRWFGEDTRNRGSSKPKGVPAPEGAVPVHVPRHIRTALLEAALVAKGAPIYRRFNTLVTPVMLTDDVTEDGVTYPKDTVLLKPLTWQRIRFMCDEYGIVFCDREPMTTARVCGPVPCLLVWHALRWWTALSLASAPTRQRAARPSWGRCLPPWPQVVSHPR